MFDSLIKFLGGRTAHEYELMKVSEESWRTRAIAAETTVELVKEIMKREQERAQKLEERLIGTPNERPMQVPPNIKPLGDRRMSSWPRIKRELEKQNRVQENAQVSREEIEKTIREG